MWFCAFDFVFKLLQFESILHLKPNAISAFYQTSSKPFPSNWILAHFGCVVEKLFCIERHKSQLDTIAVQVMIAADLTANISKFYNVIVMSQVNST